MNTQRLTRWLSVGIALLTGVLSAYGAGTIQCVADGSEGEYCGTGYGITVNVSTPSSGYTVKYAESATGPWLDEVKYVNVCTDKPIYYQVTATGYDTKVGSAKVTITPKELTNDYIWLVLPTDDYVYDGEAKEPEVAAADGDPSILTDDDWDVSFENNTDAGTATATFVGKGNYTGECYEDFEILKADNEWTTAPSIANWTYGQTPSTPVSAAKSGTATVTYSSGSVPTLPGDYTATFTVAESDNYNELTETVDFKVLPAEIHCVADGVTGEYYGEGYGITVSVSTPSSGYTIKYAEDEGGPWLDDVKYVDVCTDKPIYYQVSATGYATKTGSAKVTVTPKELTNDYIWLVLPPEDYVYDGEAKEPEVAAADGDPSILTDADWEVSYENNTDAGTATATFVGKGNYTGACTEDFEILKAGVASPAIASKVYNNTLQTAEIADTAQYEVLRNNGGRMAGVYAVVLKLRDSENYCWEASGEGVVVLPFEITSDENAWTSGPTAPTSVIGSGATSPVATTKYGDVEVRYSGTAVDGTVVENALQIVRPGTYTAKFKARTTSSWSELTASMPLTVSAAGVVSAGAIKMLSAAPVSVSGVKSMSIPRTWFSKYKGFSAKFGSDLSKAALMGTGKLDGSGKEMQVWQDYVAGTDPTKEDSRLSVKIEFEDGKPKISWTPNQNTNGKRIGERVYTVWGKKSIDDKNWTPNVDETTGEWNFFKVTVDMPEQK